TGHIVGTFAETYSRSYVVNANRRFLFPDNYISQEFAKRHHFSVTKNNVIDIAMQDKHRSLAPQIATAQIFRPAREEARFAHMFRSFKPIGFRIRSVSAAVCLIDSTPSSNSSSCPVNS